MHRGAEPQFTSSDDWCINQSSDVMGKHFEECEGESIVQLQHNVAEAMTAKMAGQG